MHNITKKSNPTPRAIYDKIENLLLAELSDDYLPYQKNDFKFVKDFLLQYKGSQDTFNAYRRELEKLTQWAWLVSLKPVIELNRQDIEQYIEFCQKPPKHWIAVKNVPRFIETTHTNISTNGNTNTKTQLRQANPEWKPFVANIAKSSVKQGLKATTDDYHLSQTALKEMFAITSSFYNYLIQIEVRDNNPLLQIRQKSKYLQKVQKSVEPIRRLSNLQWDFVITTIDDLSQQQPEKYERMYFILSIMYGMYLRISELASNQRWQPQMNHFYRDIDGCWWFKTVGKGNKLREIVVSDEVLTALKRWRKFLNLTPILPSITDSSPLLPKSKGKGGLTNSRHIRQIIQECFDLAIIKMQEQNLLEESDSLKNATVHWLRHTGISEDVKHRPREHVRDDAGHSSGAITDRYINIERRARHASGKKKTLKP